MVRAGKAAQAKSLLDLGTGKPLVTDKPMPEVDIRAIKDSIKQRYAVMTKAYALYSSSRSEQEAEAQMPGMNLAPRDIFLLRRYWEGSLKIPESAVGEFDFAALQLARKESASGDATEEEVGRKLQFLENAYRDYAANPKAKIAAMRAAVKDPKCITLIESTCRKSEEARAQRFNVEALEWAKADRIAGQMGV